MSDFMKTSVVLPHSIDMIKGRHIEIADFSNLKDNKLILYIDSLSCSSCRIAHFSDLLPLYKLSDSLGTFSVVALFSPIADNLPETELQLQVLNFPYPIYLDTNRDFAKKNVIPADSRFHDFMIDKAGKVIYVGNPTYSEQLMSVFINALK